MALQLFSWPVCSGGITKIAGDTLGDTLLLGSFPRIYRHPFLKYTGRF